MKITSRFMLLLLAWMLPLTQGNATLYTTEIHFISESSGRPLAAEIYWSDTIESNHTKLIQHGIWLREPYSKIQTCAKDKKSYPLIVFSHGFQGDRFGNSWIAEGLAHKGFIVVMIDHTLNTSYDHSDVFTYTSLWQRPVDISELISHLLNHPRWSKKIDAKKIAVAGFSLGGTTALWLGGIQADHQKLHHMMDEKYARWLDWPEYVAKKAKSVDWLKGAQSFKDDRIQAVISIAPDLGEAFTSEGLKKMQKPTLIIVGDNDSITPKDQNALYFHRFIQGAEVSVVSGAEHFTFMNRCSPLGFKITPHLCPSNALKTHTHYETIQKIDAFLKKNLKTS